MTEEEAEKILLNAPSLPPGWQAAYGMTEARRKALLQSADHPESLLRDNSETALTCFMLGNLEGWQQSLLIEKAVPGTTPRKRRGSWDPEFFRRCSKGWDSESPRSSRLAKFLANCCNVKPEKMGDCYLLFEVKTHNRALNGGVEIRNPSFLKVEREWSRFDALVICPVARTLIFIESKLEADGNHGAANHETPQPVRILEAAFFLTTAEESLFKGWDFRCLLLCPAKGSTNVEKFFGGRFEEALDKHDKYVANNPKMRCDSRSSYLDKWKELRGTLKSKLAVSHWNDVMLALEEAGDNRRFNSEAFLREAGKVELHGVNAGGSASRRWAIAGVAIS